jgi:hypothetical protein
MLNAGDFNRLDNQAYCNCIQPNIGKQRLIFKYDFLICVYKRKLE